MALFTSSTDFSIATSGFFKRSALTVARDLLGCRIAVRGTSGIDYYTITETESYHGIHDKASHASKGRTARTEVMFGKSGCMYVYLIYGMYYMLNVVTSLPGTPSAVLIRSVEGTSGPGRVTRLLGIKLRHNTRALNKTTGIWIEVPKMHARRTIIRTKRIGVEYAGPIWSEKLYRFLLVSPHRKNSTKKVYSENGTNATRTSSQHRSS